MKGTVPPSLSRLDDGDEAGEGDAQELGDVEEDVGREGVVVRLGGALGILRGLRDGVWGHV